MDPREYVHRPLELQKVLWPGVMLYSKQREIVQSVWENDETYVPAGNMLGKDYIAGLLILLFFLTRTPCRIVTTSAKADHLRALWGEIHGFIRSCRYPLSAEQGGPLIVQIGQLKKVVGGGVCPKSYVIGMVASPDSIAAMQGHHVADVGDGVPRTLFVCDESSSVRDEYLTMANTWMNRAFIFGNTW